ncbi:MAG: TolC family outer membrane protein, partial [Gammaproteobacteria bacterium]|nr:TolC family outer membrane protein [Gammaproteobacteria bacterium]
QVQANALLEVYHSARQTDPAYQGALAAADATSENEKQARGALLPQVNITASGTYRDVSVDSFDFQTQTIRTAEDNYTETAYQLSITQSILRFDQFANLAIGKLQSKQAELDRYLAEQELVARAAEAYFAFLAAKTDLVTAQAEREAISSQLEQAQKRYEVGLIAVTDVQEAQASYDLADAQLILAEQEMENAKDIMREIAGQHIDELPDLKAQIPMSAPAGSNQDWVDRAMQNNPQLARAKLQTAIANKQMGALKAGHLPSLQAEAGYGRQDNLDSPTFGSDRKGASIGLQLNIPLFSGGTTSSRARQASYQKVQAEQQTEQTRRTVERETRAAYRAMSSSIRRVQALGQAVESNKTALEATQAGYDVGTRTSVDVLAARSGLFRAQRDFAKSRYDYALSLIRLYRAEGSLSPEHLVVLNGWLENSLSDYSDVGEQP